ncbi:MAG: MBL fold metallo-hydrolase [Planctomycetota bacterium]|nr:MBL fold metallo-hydrolase [Planctomycetota bacterium]
MEIRTFELGSFQVSAYVVVAGEDAMIVDAPEGADEIIGVCDRRGLVPRILVNTHGHADHIHANAAMKKHWKAIEIAVGAGDAEMLQSPMKNLSALLMSWVKSPAADRLLADGDTIEVGPVKFQVLATPGHTPGGISLYCPDAAEGRGAVFTGDALFAGGIGRTDFPGGDYDLLLESIRKKLLTLPPETVVCPGHGPASTVGQEARSNPFLT